MDHQTPSHTIYKKIMKIVEEEYNKDTPYNYILNAVTMIFCHTLSIYGIDPTQMLEQLSTCWNNFQEICPSLGIEQSGKLEFHKLSKTETEKEKPVN